MTENTQQNVRTQEDQITALFDAIDTFPTVRSGNDRMGYKRQAAIQNLAMHHIQEAEARGAAKERERCMTMCRAIADKEFGKGDKNGAITVLMCCDAIRRTEK